ncbi:MAG: adenosylcobinamide-phosphate synthase CbiB [Pseudomonadota bacterium]
MFNFLIIIAALVLDRWLGEPARWHPLVGFGRFAQRVEHALYGQHDTQRRWRGTLAVLIVVTPVIAVAVVLGTSTWHAVTDIFLLYLVIGWRSLEDHAQRVLLALDQHDLNAARVAVGMIVSRDTRALSTQDISTATVESVLENGNDALFGALFWFLILGAPGAVTYRLINTLDAMWGYKNTRYLHFGWAAARLDDALNYVPARLTALAYSLAGDVRAGFACWRRQGGSWKSPNAGPVMAAGAGSLGVTLGGTAIYHGIAQSRPALGLGRAACASDISGALKLLRRALVGWLATIALVIQLRYFYVQY